MSLARVREAPGMSSAPVEPPAQSQPRRDLGITEPESSLDGVWWPPRAHLHPQRWQMFELISSKDRFIGTINAKFFHNSCSATLPEMAPAISSGAIPQVSRFPFQLAASAHGLEVAPELDSELPTTEENDTIARYQSLVEGQMGLEGSVIQFDGGYRTAFSAYAEGHAASYEENDVESQCFCNRNPTQGIPTPRRERLGKFSAGWRHEGVLWDSLGTFIGLQTPVDELSMYRGVERSQLNFPLSPTDRASHDDCSTARLIARSSDGEPLVCNPETHESQLIVDRMATPALDSPTKSWNPSATRVYRGGDMATSEELGTPQMQQQRTRLDFSHARETSPVGVAPAAPQRKLALRTSLKLPPQMPSSASVSAMEDCPGTMLLLSSAFTPPSTPRRSAPNAASTTAAALCTPPHAPAVVPSKIFTGSIGGFADTDHSTGPLLDDSLGAEPEDFDRDAAATTRSRQTGAGVDDEKSAADKDSFFLRPLRLSPPPQLISPLPASRSARRSAAAAPFSPPLRPGIRAKALPSSQPVGPTVSVFRTALTDSPMRSYLTPNGRFATPSQCLRTPVVERDNSLLSNATARSPLTRSPGFFAGPQDVGRYSPMSTGDASPAMSFPGESPYLRRAGLYGTPGSSIRRITREGSTSSSINASSPGLIGRPGVTGYPAGDAAHRGSRRTSLTAVRVLEGRGVTFRLDSNIIVWGTPTQMIIALGFNVYRWLPSGDTTLIFQSPNCTITALACTQDPGTPAISAGEADQVQPLHGEETFVSIGLDNGLVHVACYDQHGISTMDGYVINNSTSTVTSLQIVGTMLYVGDAQGILSIYALHSTESTSAVSPRVLFEMVSPIAPNRSSSSAHVNAASVPRAPRVVPHPRNSADPNTTPPMGPVPANLRTHASQTRLPQAANRHPSPLHATAPRRVASWDPANRGVDARKTPVERVRVGSPIFRVEVTSDGNHIAVGTATGLLVYHGACLHSEPVVVVADAEYPVRAFSWCPSPRLPLLPLCASSELSPSTEELLTLSKQTMRTTADGGQAVATGARSRAGTPMGATRYSTLPLSPQPPVGCSSMHLFSRRLVYAGGPYGTVLSVFSLGHRRPLSRRETKCPIAAICCSRSSDECIVSFVQPKDEDMLFMPTTRAPQLDGLEGDSIGGGEPSTVNAPAGDAAAEGSSASPAAGHAATSTGSRSPSASGLSAGARSPTRSPYRGRSGERDAESDSPYFFLSGGDDFPPEASLSRAHQRDFVALHVAHELAVAARGGGVQDAGHEATLRRLPQRRPRPRGHSGEESTHMPALCLFRIHDGGERLERGPALTGHTGTVVHMAVAAGNAPVVTVGTDEKLRFWSLFSTSQKSPEGSESIGDAARDYVGYRDLR